MHHRTVSSPGEIRRLRCLLHFCENFTCLGLIPEDRVYAPQCDSGPEPLRKGACSFTFRYSFFGHPLESVDGSQYIVRHDECRV